MTPEGQQKCTGIKIKEINLRISSTFSPLVCGTTLLRICKSSNIAQLQIHGWMKIAIPLLGIIRTSWLLQTAPVHENFAKIYACFGVLKWVPWKTSNFKNSVSFKVRFRVSRFSFPFNHTLKVHFFHHTQLKVSQDLKITYGTINDLIVGVLLNFHMPQIHIARSFNGCI